MRRFGVFVLAMTAAVGTSLGAGTESASAHICSVPARISVGRAATINVGVTVENVAVPDVEITIPAGLVLDRVDAVAGWTITRSGATVRYRGGPIGAFGCKYFPLGVTAPARGSFGVAVTQRDATGTIVARSTPDPARASDRLLDQIVYAGVQPPSASGSKGVSVTVIAGGALLAFGVVMIIVLRLRSRRAGTSAEAEEDNGDRDNGDGEHDDARAAELRERLERFRRRAPD